jgi:excisionase family DNA binding protein
MSIRNSNLEDSFLTVAEVAEILKLNQQTVRNWIDQGSLPAVRVGRRVRIKRSDLERKLDEGYMTGGAGSSPEVGPTAEDFWGGEAVGLAEPAAESADHAAGLAEPAAGSDDPAAAAQRDMSGGGEVDR